MWRISRSDHVVGPRRWEWVCASTAHGLIMGWAWTRRQAERRLRKAESKLYGS